MQTQLTQLIENIRSASQPNDIDHVVCDVKRVLLEAAEPNKVVSKKSKQRKQRKNQEHINLLGTIKNVKVQESCITHHGINIAEHTLTKTK